MKNCLGGNLVGILLGILFLLSLFNTIKKFGSYYAGPPVGQLVDYNLIFWEFSSFTALDLTLRESWNNIWSYFSLHHTVDMVWYLYLRLYRVIVIWKLECFPIFFFQSWTLCLNFCFLLCSAVKQLGRLVPQLNAESFSKARP